MRRLLFALLVLAGWAGLLAWAAGLSPHEPLEARHSQDLKPANFTLVHGRGRRERGALVVEQAGDEDALQQSQRVHWLDAAGLPVLRYRFGDFPSTLQLTLIWRTADAPDALQSWPLPRPGRLGGAIDLSRVPGWQGRLMEIGFAEFPALSLTPPGTPFRPFRIESAALESFSWRGRMQVLASEWLARPAWSLRSINSSGRDETEPVRPSPVLVVALAAGWLLACGFVLAGWRRERQVTPVLAVVALAWGLLDLRWSATVLERLGATRAVHAGLAWPENRLQVPDRELLQAAAAIRERLAVEAPARVLVSGPDSQASLRLVWHLAPLDAAPLNLALLARAPIPEGTLLVFHRNAAWRSDPQIARWLAASERLEKPGSLFAGGFEPVPFYIFRYRHAP